MVARLRRLLTAGTNGRNLAGRPKCSFCGADEQQSQKLIAGPGVYICDECVGLCVEMIEEERKTESGRL